MKNKKKLCFGVIIGTRAYFNSLWLPTFVVNC